MEEYNSGDEFIKGLRSWSVWIPTAMAIATFRATDAMICFLPQMVSFNPDEASNYVKECIEGIIGGVDYNQSTVNQWTASIVEQSLTQLVKQGKPFKYIVNCAVMQKSGAGLHTANSSYWDTATDGSCTVRWENRTMYCVVNVFAVAVAM
ncbi:hypothetical protein AAFF_G00209130 [Aldrovandia affinis]|uniref:Dynein light chain Tctex-type 3 n=1 Tax=Aldrovandia affinis TaxID=143900 RepID=A0AAD7WUM7_9TELE|nr:hypothetical protein AAFF_G00209130 [Aldrovandia affinis]